MIYRLACAVSRWMVALLRHPFFILAFPFACAAFVAVGWLLGRFEVFLLVETTVLSVLASWQASMVMLQQRSPELVE